MGISTLVGLTILKGDFKEHNSGKVQSTKSRKPFVLLEKFEVPTEKESIKLELEYKKRL